MNELSKISLNSTSKLDDSNSHSFTTTELPPFTAKNIIIKSNLISMDLEINGRWQPIRLAIEAQPIRLTITEALVSLDAKGTGLTLETPKLGVQIKRADQLLSLLNFIKGDAIGPFIVSPASLKESSASLLLSKLGISFAINPSLFKILSTEPKLVAKLTANTSQTTLEITDRFNDTLLKQPVSKHKIAQAIAKNTLTLMLNVSNDKPLLKQYSAESTLILEGAEKLSKISKENVWHKTVTRVTNQGLELNSESNSYNLTLKKSANALMNQNIGIKTPVISKPHKSNLNYNNPLINLSINEIKQAVQSALKKIIETPFKLSHSSIVKQSSLKQSLDTGLKQVEPKSPFIINRGLPLIFPEAKTNNVNPIVQIFSQIKQIASPLTALNSTPPLKIPTHLYAALPYSQKQKVNLHGASIPILKEQQVFKNSSSDKVVSDITHQLKNDIQYKNDALTFNTDNKKQLMTSHAEKMSSDKINKSNRRAQTLLTQTNRKIDPQYNQSEENNARTKLESLKATVHSSINSQINRYENHAVKMQFMPHYTPETKIEKQLMTPWLLMTSENRIKQNTTPLNSELLNKVSNFKDNNAAELTQLVNQAFARMIDEKHHTANHISNELAIANLGSYQTPPSTQMSPTVNNLLNNVEKLLLTFLAASKFLNTEEKNEQDVEKKLSALLKTLQPNLKLQNTSKLLNQLPNLNSPLTSDLIQLNNSLHQNVNLPINNSQNQNSENQLLMNLFLPTKIPDDCQQTHLQVGKYKKHKKGNLPEKTVWYIRLNFDYASVGRLSIQTELMDKSVECTITGNTSHICEKAQLHLDGLRRKLQAHGLQVGDIALKESSSQTEELFNHNAIVNIHI